MQEQVIEVQCVDGTLRIDASIPDESVLVRDLLAGTWCSRNTVADVRAEIEELMYK